MVVFLGAGALFGWRLEANATPLSTGGRILAWGLPTAVVLMYIVPLLAGSAPSPYVRRSRRTRQAFFPVTAVTASLYESLPALGRCLILGLGASAFIYLGLASALGLARAIRGRPYSPRGHGLMP